MLTRHCMCDSASSIRKVIIDGKCLHLVENGSSDIYEY